MRCITIIAILVALAAGSAFAQSPTTTYPYLYDNFMPGTVVMDVGNKVSYQMNIHLREGRLHYIDKDGIIKEAFLKDVAAVEIGDDVYLPVYTSMMKVVAKNDNGCVLLEQLGDFEGAISGSGAYGISSSSSATMKLTSVQTDNQINQNYMNILNEKESGMSLDILESFYIVTPKFRGKATRKDIEEALPLDRVDDFKKFIKANKIKWKNPQGLLPLLDFLAE